MTTQRIGTTFALTLTATTAVCTAGNASMSWSGQVETHPDRDGCRLVSRRHPHGRFAGIEGEDVKTFLKEVLLPLLIALCLAAFFKPVYMADGVCDYFLMWLCVGFPFGIRRMCLWLVPFGYGISGTVGIFALNIIIGGLIGGLALIVGLLLGIIHTIREII